MIETKMETMAGKYESPAVEQASRVLFCLARAQSSYISLIEICSDVGIHKSKAFSILETLRRFGLVRRNGEGKGYALGPGLISLSRKVLDDLSPTRLVEPILALLAKETRSTAVFGLIAEKEVFVAAKHEGEGDIGITMRVGHRLPVTYGAHGKAIAAFLPEPDRVRLLKERELYFHGSPAALDRKRLNRELAQCRREGFAEDRGEANRGLNVVASPVLGPNGSPVGYIEILVLFSPEEAARLGPVVSKASRDLSRELGAPADNIERGALG
jgi:DNA-binding IclR family transcriptional regulator